ncbi:MAG TPA: protoporphyrinogen oxidase, partial [Bryobacteraceae bacterium]|nr:protoporphyrinogen oxidase [Bryobacteraceae bacterium]
KSGLLGWGTKIRMGLEWFRKPPVNPPEDRSVAEFVAEHYGQEAVDYLAEPLLSGIYGGDPSRLSVGSVLPRFVELEAKYGSLTKGVLHARKKAAQQAKGMPLFQTLKSGLGQLTDVLSEKAAPVVIHGEAEAVERQDAAYRVRVDGAWIEADQVVLACQAYEAGAVVRPVDPDLAALLGAVEYSSSITISIGYDRAKLGYLPNGFGFLVPKRERRRMMACTFIGTKFSHRIPDDKVVMRCFVGGQDEAPLALSDETLAGEIREELREILGVTAEPSFVRISRWPRSMAQYTVGHARRMAHVEARIAHLPGLYVAGNAYTGIGVPDCVRMGKSAADKIAAGG